MSAKDKLNIIIAETSPVISSGFSHTLRRLPFAQVHVSEVTNLSELKEGIRSLAPGILIVNPSFGGVLDPSLIREGAPDNMKIIAIEIAKLEKHARKLFDDVISVADDFDTISGKIKALSAGEEESAPDKEMLSQREKEIIALVVKGMTNKEIADNLFISVHTVITHRRNIARKLEIHSATGLTIYAIVNHIVDISEIKL